MRAYFIAQPRDAARFLLAAASLLELMWLVYSTCKVLERIDKRFRESMICQSPCTIV